MTASPSGRGHARLGRVDELSGNRGLVAAFYRQQSIAFVTMTRSGRVDRLRSLPPSKRASYGFCDPIGRESGCGSRTRGEPQEYDLVLYPVDEVGRIGRPDTVYRQLAITTSGDHNDDAEVYDYGPSEYSVWALARDGPVVHELVAAPARDGDRIVCGASCRPPVIVYSLAGAPPQRPAGSSCP